MAITLKGCFIFKAKHKGPRLGIRCLCLVY